MWFFKKWRRRNTQGYPHSVTLDGVSSPLFPVLDHVIQTVSMFEMVQSEISCHLYRDCIFFPLSVQTQPYYRVLVWLDSQSELQKLPLTVRMAGRRCFSHTAETSLSALNHLWNCILSVHLVFHRKMKIHKASKQKLTRLNSAQNSFQPGVSSQSTSQSWALLSTQVSAASWKVGGCK